MQASGVLFGEAIADLGLDDKAPANKLEMLRVLLAIGLLEHVHPGVRNNEAGLYLVLAPYTQARVERLVARYNDGATMDGHFGAEAGSSPHRETRREDRVLRGRRPNLGRRRVG